MSAIYDPTLTMEANARRLLDVRSPFQEQYIAEALRAAYTDGWNEARSRQLAGLQIEEVAPV
jgi:hypothetical protein